MRDRIQVLPFSEPVSGKAKGPGFERSVSSAQGRIAGEGTSEALSLSPSLMCVVTRLLLQDGSPTQRHEHRAQGEGEKESL